MLVNRHLFYKKFYLKENNSLKLPAGKQGWICGLAEDEEGNVEGYAIDFYDEEYGWSASPNDIEILDEYDLEKKAEAEERRKNRENIIRVRVDEHGAGHIVDEED